MEATGVIFAALDCDADAIEAWNRWYDLEHLPPNLALEGVVTGRRYVATPELHEARRGVGEGGYAGGRSSFLTIYTLTGDPRAAFQGMTELREELVRADRMFADEKKIVRDGDVFSLDWVRADPALRARPVDVPFIGHTSLLVVMRRGADPLRSWYSEDRASRLVEIPGVHGALGLTSLNRPELSLELVLVEAPPLEVLEAVRDRAPEHSDSELVVEGAFRLIDPLRYDWAEWMRSSWLPAKVS
jgi:hypothetical protein